ncbi:hypothetical protein [Streptomyces acidiscabies]|uniref:Uncharacterized protein n=1 Tax=Streptomyces acidiscabies TaxID=42234 RepID=A0A0L0JXE6_9ACTN|nr:hypothetical protein [Streptomyces acidiscabies]KND30193.1 hypothetical protein IQ63_29435 [Streptomyces acidiscabies]
MPDRPFVIWKGHGADQGIYSARCDQGTEFHDVRKVSWFASSRGLAAVVVPGGNGIRAAWRGAGADEHIWYSVLGPHGWTPQQVTSDGTASSSHGPALAEHKGRLFMVWKGSGGNQNLYWCVYDGYSWTQPTAFPGGSTHGPALASNGFTLTMVWKGSGNDDSLWRATYGDNGWSAQHPAIGRSSHGPALSRVDNRITIVWKGAGGDERLWWTPDNFASQRPLGDGLTTSDTPAVIPLNFSDL